MMLSIIIPVGDRDVYRRCKSSIERSIAAEPGFESEVIEVFDDERRGVAWARNEGLGRAKGEWIAWVDCDDEVAPGWFGEICAAIESSPAADVVSFDAKVVWDDSPSRAAYTVGGAANAADVMAERAAGQMWNKVIRRGLFDGLEFTGAVHEDYRLLCGLLPRVKETVHIARELYVYHRMALGLSQHLDHAAGAAALKDLVAMTDSVPAQYRADMAKGVTLRIADFSRRAPKDALLRRFVRANLLKVFLDSRIALRIKIKVLLAI